MADEGDRLAGVIERPYQGQHGFRAPQLVRRVPARDDQGVEISGGDPVDGGVDGDWPVSLLPSDRLAIETATVTVTSASRRR